MDNPKRRVSVFSRKWIGVDKYEVTHLHDGTFHCWGADVEEGDSGFASYSVGIVELDDGTVITAIPQNIKFIGGRVNNEP